VLTAEAAAVAAVAAVTEERAEAAPLCVAVAREAPTAAGASHQTTADA